MRFRLVASCKSFSPGTTNKQTNKQWIERQSEKLTEIEKQGERDGDRRRLIHLFVSVHKTSSRCILCGAKQNQGTKGQAQSPQQSPLSPPQPQLQQYQAAASIPCIPLPSLPWHMGAPRRWHRTSMSPKTETKKLHI